MAIEILFTGKTLVRDGSLSGELKYVVGNETHTRFEKYPRKDEDLRLDKTLIVGNLATKNCNAPIFPEYTPSFVIDELDKFDKRAGDIFYITEETERQLRKTASFRKNNCLHDRGMALFPEEVLNALPCLGIEDKLNAGDAHLVLNYERVINEGLLVY